MDSEALQESIHINLILLYNKGHNIDFVERMFQVRNLPGFEKVAYALSVIIDPEEVKKTIPWPLLDDKKLRNEFRLKFCKFIKTVNTKYGARIPELPASNFQNPGGLMFLNFMNKLSTFTIELELKRMMTPEEKANMWEIYDQCKTEDVEVCTNICTGLRLAEEERMQEHAEYQADALSTIRELEKGNKILEDKIKIAQEKLRSSLTDLLIDEDMKNRLSDISCNAAMKEWNERTEVKINELQKAKEQLWKVSDLTSSVTQMIRKSAGNQKEDIQLDGSKMKIPHSMAKFSNAPVRSDSGDIKLQTIFDAGLAALDRLTLTGPTQPSQLSWAKELETKVLAHRQRVRKCSDMLHSLETMCKTEIAELRPILYDRVRNRKRPEWFTCLRSLPLVLPSKQTYATNNVRGRKRRLPNVLKSELLKKKKNTMNVKTSFKLKRSSLHPMMTPSLLHLRPKACSTALRPAVEPPTSFLPRAIPSMKKSRPSLSTVYKPSCKKSLYGKLPTGIKLIEDSSQAALENDLECPPVTMTWEGSEESGEQSRASSQCEPPVEKLTQEKNKRRSIDRVIERFRQLKARQNESAIASHVDSKCSQTILEQFES